MQTLPPQVSAPRIPSASLQMNDAGAERRRRVAEVAYSLGLSRGFEGGIEEAIQDWVKAEEIVDERANRSPSFRA